MTTNGRHLILVSITVGLAAMAMGMGRLKGPSKPSSGERLNSTVTDDSPKSPPPSENRFVVHEWGTFTSFSNQQGVNLEFRPLGQSDLPAFVYNREFQNYGPIQKGTIRTQQRMETPVTYFYTDRPRDVRVRVDFPRGLLTEFYPPVMEQGPQFTPNELLTLEESFLDWGQVRLIPPELLASETATEESEGLTLEEALPPVEGENHYAHARATDSAIVAVDDPASGRHYEKFLFYRGVGNFDSPLRFEALGEGRFRVTNSGHEGIASLFLVEIDGGLVHFAYCPTLAGNSTARFSMPRTSSSVSQLAEEMVLALTRAGLYAKESAAMVDTWRSSWFGESGTRLLYVVPSRLTDELLPLAIEPAPDQIVRVLVGRMEILTPERREEIAHAVRGMSTCAAVSAEPLRSEIAHLGRFTEPALESLLSYNPDPSWNSVVKTLVSQAREEDPR